MGVKERKSVCVQRRPPTWLSSWFSMTPSMREKKNPGGRNLTCTCIVLGICVFESIQDGNLPYESYTGLYTFVDEPARFGPRIPESGVSGQLVLAEPLDACDDIRPPPANTTSIVLIQRGQRNVESASVAGGDTHGENDTNARTNATNVQKGGGAYVPKTCTFYDKVMRAQAAGYAAAIIFDNEYEGLIIMNGPSSQRADEAVIPSVFISLDDGNVIATLLSTKRDEDTYYAILSDSSINEQLWGNMLASMFMAALCLSIILASVIVIRRRRSLNQLYIRLALDALQEQNENGGGANAANTVMQQEDLDTLPVTTFNSAVHGSTADDGRESGDGGGSVGGADAAAPVGGQQQQQQQFCIPVGSTHNQPVLMAGYGHAAGGTWETCTICLDDYEDGDLVRELACGHAFHKECIDMWLTTKASFCPMCKADCSVSTSRRSAGSAATQNAGEAAPALSTEETPLLGEVASRVDPALAGASSTPTTSTSSSSSLVGRGDFSLDIRAASSLSANADDDSTSDDDDTGDDDDENDASTLV